MDTLGGRAPDTETETPPVPLWAAIALCPIFVLWMLPQTLAGLTIALHRRAHGHKVETYRFGLFLCWLVRARGPGTAGISLGLVVFAADPRIIRHELCHIITGLWLGWLYLPVYGLEYLLVATAAPDEAVASARCSRKTSTNVWP